MKLSVKYMHALGVPEAPPPARIGFPDPRYDRVKGIFLPPIERFPIGGYGKSIVEYSIAKIMTSIGDDNCSLPA